MARMNNTIEVTCRECGRIWTRRLLLDVNTLNEAVLKLIKKGVCNDCRTRMNREFVTRNLGKRFEVYEEED